MSQLLSLCIVCLTAYVVSERLYPKPMNRILLERSLAAETCSEETVHTLTGCSQ